MTLLVLDVRLPEDFAPRDANDLLKGLLGLAPKFLPYVLSFAVLGLRALYFFVSGFLKLFHLLRFGLAAVLVFIGAKMLLSDVYPIPILTSLMVVAGFLAASVGASVVWKEKKA